jgi:hypothetical protein
MAEYERGKMDITEQEKTFEGFLRMWVYVFGFALAALIFMSLFNS